MLKTQFYKNARAHLRIVKVHYFGQATSKYENANNDQMANADTLAFADQNHVTRIIMHLIGYFLFLSRYASFFSF